jgi:lipid-binding SYLF domain-containing protein
MLVATRRCRHKWNAGTKKGTVMSRILPILLTVLTATSAFAALPADEAKRLHQATTVLSEFRQATDKGIPEAIWAEADCAVVIPSVKKAAFVFGGEYGRGVMSCKQGNRWSPPVFMQLAKGSWGLQIGAQEIDLVLLVMNRRGVEKLLEDKVSLGADASVAAGPMGHAANAGTDARLSAQILAYSRAQGLFAGIDLSGGVLRPDTKANERAYGPQVKAADVVLGQADVAAPQEARAFTAALGRDVRATSGRK